MTIEEIKELQKQLKKYASALDRDEKDERESAEQVIDDINRWLGEHDTQAEAENEQN
jgi:hypothetical protein